MQLVNWEKFSQSYWRFQANKILLNTKKKRYFYFLYLTNSPAESSILAMYQFIISKGNTVQIVIFFLFKCMKDIPLNAWGNLLYIYIGIVAGLCNIDKSRGMMYVYLDQCWCLLISLSPVQCILNLWYIQYNSKAIPSQCYQISFAVLWLFQWQCLPLLTFEAIWPPEDCDSYWVLL